MTYHEGAGKKKFLHLAKAHVTHNIFGLNIEIKKKTKIHFDRNIFFS